LALSADAQVIGCRFTSNLASGSALFQVHFSERSGRGASDYTNTILNYGYALLEAECLRVINTVGLDPCIGFFHIQTHFIKNRFNVSQKIIFSSFKISQDSNLLAYNVVIFLILD